MTTKTASVVLGAALLLATAGSAMAADLYSGGSVKDEYVSAPSTGPSWYARIDGGYGWHTDPDMMETIIDTTGSSTLQPGSYDLTDTSIDAAWTLGGGIGYYFDSHWRGDVTYDHRFEADAQGTIESCCTGIHKFGIESDVILVNAYYDFNRGGRWSPYLGAGIGVARNQTTEGTYTDDCGCSGVIGEDSETNFAVAAMAGLTVRLRGGQTVEGGIKDAPVVIENGRSLYLDVGYRYLFLGDAVTGPVVLDNSNTTRSNDAAVDNIDAHEVRVGLRYDLR